MHAHKSLLLALAAFAGCAVDNDGTTDSPAPLDDVARTAPTYAWARMLTGPSNEDEIDAVASDVNNNVYISGKFEQTLTIEGTSTKLTSAGMADIMVVKYSSTGALQWTRRYGSTGEDNVFDADTDAAGNLYLSGYFGGTVSFGNFKLTSVGDLDMMVVKLSPSGTVLWATRMGGPATDGGNEISIGPDGTIAVLAGSAGTFTAGSLTFPSSSLKQQGILLTLDPATGNVRWGAQIAGTGVTRLKCLAIDGSGNVYAGGDYGGSMSVIASNTTVPLPAPRGIDAYFTAWTPGGQLRWTKAFGGTGADLCKGLAATSTGDVYSVGYVSDGVSFDGRAMPVVGRDLYVWKLDKTGATRWLNQISSSVDLSGSEITLTPDDGVVFGFDADAAVTYGSTDGTTLVVQPPTPGVRWPRLSGYRPDGTPRDPLLPATCTGDASMDEIAHTGLRAYVDVPIFGGTYTFGPDTRTGTATKDALIVAVDL